MIRKISFMLVLSLIVAGFTAGAVSADAVSALNLPTGIAKQAQPLIDQMMESMQQMGTSDVQMQMMMADMQTMADQLPPGIFLQILELMPQLDMADMMTLHPEMHGGDLLQQPPGQILIFVREFAQ